MSQKRIGDAAERKCLDFFQRRGYWCHLFEQGVNGQPCDVIAIKGGMAILVDVKHCDGDRFEFRRIEANQRSCFRYAIACGNEACGFMVYFERRGRFNYVPFKKVEELEARGEKGIRFSESGALI